MTGVCTIASGGIVSVLVARLENSGRYDNIHAGARNALSAARRETKAYSFDLTDEPSMRRDGRWAFAVFFARVGSIAHNPLGGGHSYRASKTGLNMLVRSFAIKLATRNPHAIAVAIHPDTAETALSKPFQRNIPQGKLLPPDQSASHIPSVIDQLSPADSGGLFAWNGERTPF